MLIIRRQCHLALPFLNNSLVLISPTDHQIWKVLNDKDGLNTSEISWSLIDENVWWCSHFPETKEFPFLHYNTLIGLKWDIYFD
jgi:hypothetical protein